MHYTNFNFLQYGCPGGTQLPELQPAVFLLLPEPSPGICGSLQGAVPRDVLAEQAGCGSGCSHSPGSCLFLVLSHLQGVFGWEQMLQMEQCQVEHGVLGSAGAAAAAALQIPGASPGCSSLAQLPEHSCLLRGVLVIPAQRALLQLLWV